LLRLPHVWVSSEGQPVPGSVYFRAVIRLLGKHHEELLELVADEKKEAGRAIFRSFPTRLTWNKGKTPPVG
jgi:hypothetical protein